MNRLSTLVGSYPGQPVFVTGGPPRTPFTGAGAERWTNPDFALHHALSWGSPFVLGAMPPLRPSADPRAPSSARLLERHEAALAKLAEGQLPVIAQVWGPMTMASTRLGLEVLLTAVHEGSRAEAIMEEGLEATLVSTHIALRARPLVLWIAEPLPVLVDPETLERTWIAPMRTLIAVARTAGAEPVVHASGPASHLLPLIERVGAAGVSITADTPLMATRESLGEHTVVFGNLDSMRLLDRDPDWLAEEARNMVSAMAGRSFVVTPGSALPGDTPLEALTAFVDAARGES